MKKRIVLFTLIAGISYLIFSSYSAGPGTNSYDCSGADVNSGSGNPAGCTTGGGCHGSAATPGITFTIEIDSAGTPVSTSPTTGHYTPGYTYTIKITGTNTTTSSLPKWGFQVAATNGAVAATVPVNAGTLQSTGLPTGIHYVAAPGTTATFFANVVEHDTRLSPTSGTGGTGTVYSTSFTWTAPVAGTGVVSLFGALNAVNNNGSADAGDLWNTAQLILNEIVIPATPPITGTFTVCVGSTTPLSDAGTGGTWSSSATGVATVGLTTGIVSGVSAGTAIISYITGTGTATQVITVNPIPSAGSITGASTVCQGTTISLTDASAGGVWSSSNTAVGSVSGTGVVGGISGGTTTISYTVTNGCGSATATHVVTVTPLPSVGTITGIAEFCVGTGTTLTDAATGGAWSSSNTAVATVGVSGAVLGVSGGTATISYTLTNACGSAHASQIVTVDVLSAGTISGLSGVCIGTSTTLTDATTGGTWSSSNTAVATVVASTGVVTGVAGGTSTITYSVTNTCGTSFATHIVTVIATPTVGAISGTNVFCQGTTSNLTDGTTGGIWSSSNTAVATVGSTTGIASGIAGGTAIISYTVTYSCTSVTATYPVTINPLPVVAAITGAAAFCHTTTTTLSDATTGGVWSSSNAGVATVGTSSGLVSPVTAGNVIISYKVTNGCGNTIVTKAITIDSLPPLVTIAGSATVCQTGTTTLTDIAPGGTWASSNTTIATVGSTNGVVSGISGGSVTITYSIVNTCGSVSATKSMIVNPLPYPGAISSGTYELCIGAPVQFLEGVSGGAWTSGNMAIATVNAGLGIVTGVSAGTTIITYTVSNACGNNIATHQVTVYALPVPAISVSGDILSSTMVFPAYEWIRNGSMIPGATYQSYTALLSGAYTLLVTDAHGCTGTSAAYDYVFDGVNNVAPAANNIRVYPNPTQSVLFIESTSKADAVLSTMEGRVLLDIKNVKQIDLSSLPNGTYFITVFDGESGAKLGTEKVLKTGN